jgi:hypothetical protein
MITKDNYKIKEGNSIWYVNGDSCHGASFRSSFHELRYVVYKKKSNALRHLKVRGLN